MFSCIGNTSWVEAWHNPQRDSAAYGIGMIFADLTLHESVDRWNVNSADTKFPEGDPERKTKKAEAQRVRELALLKLRRRKKSKAKPSSRAAGETS